MQRKSIGFGPRGTLLMIYQVLAYVGYTAFTNFPQNVMSEFYGGTTTTTLMNLIGGIVGYLITYLIIAPRIGRIKNTKRVGIIIGLISLVFCALICVIPPTMRALWCVAFVLVLISTQLWACFFVTMLIGNWFPRRKGTVMGIVTIAFPIVTGICLNLFMVHFYSLLGSGAPPLGTVVGAAFPFIIASIAARFTYNGAFLFIGIMAVISLISLALFNPRRLAKYDNKLREAAGLPVDDVLEQRLLQEKRKKSTVSA